MVDNDSDSDENLDSGDREETGKPFSNFLVIVQLIFFFLKK